MRFVEVQDCHTYQSIEVCMPNCTSLTSSTWFAIPHLDPVRACHCSNFLQRHWLVNWFSSALNFLVFVFSAAPLPRNLLAFLTFIRPRVKPPQHLNTGDLFPALPPIFCPINNNFKAATDDIGWPCRNGSAACDRNAGLCIDVIGPATKDISPNPSTNTPDRRQCTG